jgi:hypothetical protein
MFEITYFIITSLGIILNITYCGMRYQNADRFYLKQDVIFSCIFSCIGIVFWPFLLMILILLLPFIVLFFLGRYLGKHYLIK